MNKSKLSNEPAKKAKIPLIIEPPYGKPQSRFQAGFDRKETCFFIKNKVFIQKG